MATNGAGFTESLVHAPVSTQGPFAYRAGLGLMTSAEYCTHFDDFIQFIVGATAITNGPGDYTPTGWTDAIIDTGATLAQDTTAGHSTGVIKMADATASEGVAIYMPKSIQLTAGKKFFMELRVKTDDVTDNAIQFGLSDLTAVTNPEDLWTTTAANLVTFGILDGAATTSMLCDKSNSGSTAETGSRSMVANTWHTLAISYDGASTVKGWVDGYVSNTWAQTFASTVPVGVALAPFIGVLNGNGAGGNNNYIDFFRFAIQR